MVSGAPRGVGDPLPPPSPTPLPKLIIDFDGTLIREHFLVEWVWYLLRAAGLRRHQRARFFLKALLVGSTSKFLSRFSLLSVISVRLAYRVFRNMDVRSIERMIAGDRRMRKAGMLTQNPGVSGIIERMIRRGTFGEIWIVSQGAPEPAIRAFLRRRDMAEWLAGMGVGTDRIRVVANRLVCGMDGRFSGRLDTPVQTKFSRLALLRDGDVMIGDPSDERVFRNRRMSPEKFINWKTTID